MQAKVLGALIALSCGAATAGTIQIGGQAAGADGKITNKAGVCTVTFNGGTTANACGATYSANAGAAVVQGNVSGLYANPAGDSTFYLSVSPSTATPVTVTLATPANYFGFFAGSLDSYNLVQFFLNGIQVDSFTGADINAVAFPGTSAGGNQALAQFIDYFPTSFFNSVLISSSANAFETDSHAFGVAAPSAVPEPGSVSLLGLGALALYARRRRAARRA